MSLILKYQSVRSLFNLQEKGMKRVMIGGKIIPRRETTFILCASPCYSSPDLLNFTFRKIQCPIFPLDKC